MERFNPTPWFDLVADNSANPTLTALLPITTKYPVRTALVQLRELVRKVDEEQVLQALLSGIDAILDGSKVIKNNYRYRFHPRPRYKHESCVSACSEFFSLLKQALMYRS